MVQRTADLVHGHRDGLRDMVYVGVFAPTPLLTVEIHFSHFRPQHDRLARRPPLLHRSAHQQRRQRHERHPHLRPPRRPPRARLPHLQTLPPLDELKDLGQHYAGQRERTRHAPPLPHPGCGDVRLGVVLRGGFDELELQQHHGHLLVQSRHHDDGRLR